MAASLAAFLRRLPFSMDENPMEKKDMILCGGLACACSLLWVPAAAAAVLSLVAPPFRFLEDVWF